MSNDQRAKLEGIVSRLNPEVASEDAKAFIEVTSQMVRELGYRSRLLYTSPAEEALYRKYFTMLTGSAGEMQRLLQTSPTDHRYLLREMEFTFRLHLEIYNHLGFPEITINHFLACQVKYEKCLDILAYEWTKYPFMDEVEFFLDGYFEMFHHHFRLNALEVTKKLRSEQNPGESPP